MQINVYYIIVGIFSVLFSFTHGWNGYNSILPLIDATNLKTTIKTTIFYVWHIISIENFIFGIAFFIMAFYKNPAEIRFTAWTIVSIILARWIIISGATLLKDASDLKSILIDSIAIVIYVGLIILGIRN